MTPLPGPIILLGLPLLSATLSYFLRRWSLLAAGLSVLTTGVLTLLCLRLPLDRAALVLGQEVAFGRPIVVAGRNLILDPAGQVWLAFVFALSTLIYLLAWRLRPGRSFYPFTLVILGLFALTTLLETFSQRRTFNVPHRVVIGPLRLTVVEDRHNIRMIEACGSFCLQPESIDRLGF